MVIEAADIFATDTDIAGVIATIVDFFSEKIYIYFKHNNNNKFLSAAK